MRSPSCHLSVPTIGEPPTLGVLISPKHCDLSGGNSGWSQIQIQWFTGAGVKTSWEIMGTTFYWRHKNPSLCWLLLSLLLGPMDSLLQWPVVFSTSWGTAWIQPSGPQKGPWSPAWMVIVSRSVFTVFQASGLIKTAKGSNPWIPLKDLQLLPFMK